MLQSRDEILHQEFAFFELVAEFPAIRVRDFMSEVRKVPLQNRQELTFFPGA